MTASGLTTASPLVPLTPAGSHPVSLICIPHAGAGVAAFHQWRELGRFAALWAVRFPGRESRLAEQPLTTIDEMAEALAPAVSEITSRSIVLFGHCSGALVAYELASRLASLHRGAAELRLILSSQPAPFGSGPPTGQSVARMSRAELADRLRALGGTPEAVLANPRLMALMEPAVRADLLATERYRPRAPKALPYDIVVLAASDDQAITADSLQPWRDCTVGSFQIKWFEGQHFFVTRAGQGVVQYLAEMLRSMR
jgi:surfactin synthase thioesterase subunit